MTFVQSSLWTELTAEPCCRSFSCMGVSSLPVRDVSAMASATTAFFSLHQHSMLPHMQTAVLTCIVIHHFGAMLVCLTKGQARCHRAAREKQAAQGKHQGAGGEGETYCGSQERSTSSHWQHCA
jgi:hypothetical protein